MKKLSEQMLYELAQRVLTTPGQYKDEYDNPYHRAIVRRMLIDAMKLALEAADDSKTTEQA